MALRFEANLVVTLTVDSKPQAFVGKRHVFVSTNYRFVPVVTIQEIACDIAKTP